MAQAVFTREDFENWLNWLATTPREELLREKDVVAAIKWAAKTFDFANNDIIVVKY